MREALEGRDDLRGWGTNRAEAIRDARITFYEYALGSTREARDWYYKGRHALDDAVVSHRFDMTSAIIRLTLTMITAERRKARRAPGRPNTNLQ